MISFACWSRSLLRAMSKSGPWFYAVKHGRVPGVYNTWPECEHQVKGFNKPTYKKFSSFLEAQNFIGEQGANSAAFTILNKSISSPGFCHKTGTAVFSASSPVASKDTTSASSASSVTSVSVASLNSQVQQMQGSIDRLLGVVEGLSSEVGRIQETVTRLESAIFIAPGAKRNFSSMAKDPDGVKDRKRLKKNKSSVGGFSGLKFEERDGVNVYTDGGCFDNGRSGARAGIGVYWGRDDPHNVSETLTGRPSNNRAEIHAAVKAVQIAKRRGIKNLIIHTDSQFLINGITKWIKGWKKNGWKLTTGLPVINKDDFSALDNELLGISVKWVYVKGHSGNPANEEADRLAKQGAEKAGLTGLF